MLQSTPFSKQNIPLIQKLIQILCIFLLKLLQPFKLNLSLTIDQLASILIENKILIINRNSQICSINFLLNHNNLTSISIIFTALTFIWHYIIFTHSPSVPKMFSPWKFIKIPFSSQSTHILLNYLFVSS